MFEKVAALEAENSQLREQLHQATAAAARATERASAAEEAAAAQASTQACHQSGPQGPGSTAEEGEAEGGGDRLEDLSRPQLLARLLALQQEVAGIQEQRRRAHNQAVEMRGAVRVFVRVRPPAPNQSSSAVRTLPDGSTVGVSSGSQETLFSFGRVFGPSASQQQVFGEVQELVQSALDGYHVCIASYGQTGSGKTHNMTGDGTPDGKGLIPRAVEKPLARAAQPPPHDAPPRLCLAHGMHSRKQAPLVPPASCSRESTLPPTHVFYPCQAAPLSPPPPHALHPCHMAQSPARVLASGLVSFHSTYPQRTASCPISCSSNHAARL
ncbi:kinesin-2, partial [Haematococcus lacustris]